MLPRISSSGLRRVPSIARIGRGHAVDVVGAHRQRDLRELRAVERPVHLNRRDVPGQQPRQRDLLHVVVAGGRRRNRHRRAAAARRRGSRRSPAADPRRAMHDARSRSRPAQPREPSAATRRASAARAAIAAAPRLAEDRPGPRRRPRGRRRAATAQNVAAATMLRRSASRSASEKPVTGTPPASRRAAGPRRPPRRATAGVPRCGIRPRQCAAAATRGGASTCTSNTRTNVVRGAVQAPAHVVGDRADGDQIGLSSITLRVGRR